MLLLAQVGGSHALAPRAVAHPLAQALADCVPGKGHGGACRAVNSSISQQTVAHSVRGGATGRRRLRASARMVPALAQDMVVNLLVSHGASWLRPSRCCTAGSAARRGGPQAAARRPPLAALLAAVGEPQQPPAVHVAWLQVLSFRAAAIRFPLLAELRGGIPSSLAAVSRARRRRQHIPGASSGAQHPPLAAATLLGGMNSNQSAALPLPWLRRSCSAAPGCALAIQFNPVDRCNRGKGPQDPLLKPNICPVAYDHGLAAHRAASQQLCRSARQAGQG